MSQMELVWTRDDRTFFLIYPLVIILYYFRDVSFLVCPIRFITGIPCPGCGGRRVVEALLDGRIVDALCINPLSVLLVVIMIVLPFVFYLRPSWWTALFHRQWKLGFRMVAYVLLLADWIWVIYNEL